MNYDEAMTGAERSGTARRNKRRQFYRMATWSVGVVAILAALIWLSDGPLQTYSKWNKEKELEKKMALSQTRQTITQAPQECTSANPCAPTVGNVVHVPQGKSVCFEPFFWSNIQRLGVRTSYKGGSESGYNSIADSFRFVPETGVILPKYWFVPEGSSKC